jgi:protein-S-isoprenylcysteine O-methyltransferase Ste14
MQSAATIARLWLLGVPHEEQMMVEEFGDEYRSYTGRIFPRLGK